jgi:hypothetical protein
MVVRDGSGILRWRDECVRAVIVVYLPVASGLPTREIKGGHTHENNVF